MNAVGFFHQHIQRCRAIVALQHQHLPILCRPSVGLRRTGPVAFLRVFDDAALRRQFTRANAAPKGREHKNNHDHSRDAGRIGAEQQMPNAFDAQQPGRKNKQARQRQPFKPNRLNQ